MRPSILLLASLVFLSCAPVHGVAVQPAVATLAANDNRVPAGTLRDGVLTLHLEIAEGDWQAEDALPAWRMLAFAEAGMPAATPGPLIRVARGTSVDVSVSNDSDSELWIHGLHAHRSQHHRIRLIGITAVSTVHVALLRENEPVTWRPLAKDGADLPPPLTATRPAEVDISPGEIFDFDYAADEAECCASKPR